MPDDQPKSDFEVAQAIKTMLALRNQDEQQRILRWVRESLGISESRFSPEPPASSISSPPQEGSPVGTEQVRPKSIRDFVAEKQPKSDMQFAAVVAYYFRFEVPTDKRREEITTEDLQDAARLAQWSRFTQPSGVLRNAKNQGYLDPAGDRGSYRINAVGENLVAMTLPGGFPTGTAARSKSKRTTTRRTKSGTTNKRDGKAR